MEIFLRIKNWQLFSLFLIPIILPFLTNSFADSYFKIVVFLLFIFAPIIVFILWIYATGNFLGKIEESKTYQPRKLFNYNLMSVVIYFVFLYAYAFYKNDGYFSTNLIIVSSDSSEKPLFTGQLAVFIFFISMYILFAIYYNFHFIAKNISFLEGKEKTWAYFFLIWFFPIGLWFLQPKLNKIYTSKNTLVE